jgi:uncharacterized SAM-dependent methyltransferase
MKLEIILTEGEIAEEFSEAMQARDLPEKCLYWFPLSVQAWLALAHDPAYDGLGLAWRSASERLVPEVRHFGTSVPVISFGAGDGSRDQLLLDAVRHPDRELKYFPVDASQTLLEIACSHTEDADIEAVGIKADISSPVHLVFAADAAESPKLFVMAGNTLGAFDPLDQIRHVAESMREGDRLLIDGELYGEQTLARREQPAVHRFVMAPLASLGVTGDDGEPRFELKRDERHDGLYMVTRHFRAGRDLPIRFAGQEVLVERGERISMNFQYTYTTEAFRWLLEERGGLQILQEYPSPDGRFMVALCSR